MTAQVEETAKRLGIGTFELFSRARAGYGCAGDSARTAYNKYTAFGDVPTFVKCFIQGQEAKEAHAKYLSDGNRDLRVVNGGLR